MRLVLIGCTGFVGQELVPQLLASGHELTVISRKGLKPKSNQVTPQDKLIDLKLDLANPQSWRNSVLIDALSKAEGVVNLAGEPIADKRWTPKQLEKIETSRLNTTQFLIDAINQQKKQPRVLINASAIGYYGTSQDAQFSENSPAGKDFLATLCQRWESIAKEKPRATRLVVVRIGIVIGPSGGALSKMLPIFKSGLGGPIGNGRQWMSWIQRTDLCQIIEKALTNKSWSGVLNCVAPKPVSMAEFASSLGKCLGRPSVLPVPGAILKIILGDGAKVVLEGQYVQSNLLTKLGYRFKYSEINQALNATIKPLIQ